MTSAVPPTSGALPIVESANLSSGPYGGGGGGSIGPNPVVSTLTLNPSGGIQGSVVQLNNPSLGSFPTNGFTFNTANSGAGSFAITNPDTGSVHNTLTISQFNGGEAIITTYNNSAATYNSLAIQASTTSISSLIVSSINGAAPGGGGGAGPNLSVSSINVSSGGYIEMFTGPSNDTGRIIGYRDINNASSMSLFVGFVPNYASKVNGTDGLWLIENDSTGVNQAFGDFGAGRLVVLGNNAGASKPVPVLDSDGNGNLEVNAVGALTISTVNFFVPYAETTISSLSVSSINGAAPGGGGTYPQNSTLKTSDGTGLSINASSLTTLAAYSTISSHFYTVSVDIGPRQLTQAFGPNDGFQTQLTTDDGLVNILNDGLWSQISTLNNLAITPELGGSATFKAGGSFFTIDIYNTYASTLSTNLNAIFAVDHGPGN